MTEKPTNMVNLGGLSFNANLAKDYGVKPELIAGKKYFINLKDGTKIEYAEQAQQEPLFNFGEQKKSTIDISLDNNNYYTFDNLENADIDFSGTERNQYSKFVHLENPKNVKITGSPSDDWVTMDNAENCEVATGEGNDKVFANGKNIKINTGAGDDSVYIANSKNVDIDGGAGSDEIQVRSFDGKPDGKVHLDNDDTLLVGSPFAGNQVKVQGEGTHNLADTRALALGPSVGFVPVQDEIEMEEPKPETVQKKAEHKEAKPEIVQNEDFEITSPEMF